MHPHDSESTQILIKQTALYSLLAISRSGLAKLKKRDPSFPKPVKDGSTRQAAVYYVRAEVEAWLANKLATRPK